METIKENPEVDMSGQRRMKISLTLYKYRNVFFKLLTVFRKIPGTDAFMGFFKKPLNRNMSFTYIPVLEDIDTPPGTVLPLNIVEQFIEKSCYHVIMDYCVCRKTANCENYPVEFACIMLGKGAREIDPSFSRHVSKEEALAHLEKAKELGLPAMAGRFLFDAIVLGVKDHMHLMTVCFCCPCCCLGKNAPTQPKWIRDLGHKIEGSKALVTDECTGCGNCVDSCLYEQISIVNGRKVIGEECKCCGLCSFVCAHGATRIVIDDEDYIEETVSRISDFVDVT